MIISRKHKYLFIEIPRTGSTSISRELADKYDGKNIFEKHANYFEFLRKFRKEERKRYFVFAGVRNPMDDVVSKYEKYLSNHKNNYTDQSKLLVNGGHVTKNDIIKFNFVQKKGNTFSDFVKQFYTQPYTSNINSNKKFCDYIIRFEEIDKGFDEALKKIGLEKKRELPRSNITKDKKPFLSYFDEDIKDHSIRVFGPYMKEWGYEFPKEWRMKRIPLLTIMHYNAYKIIRYYYLKFVKSGPLKNLFFLRTNLE